MALSTLMLSRGSPGGVWNMTRMISSLVSSDGSNFLARGYGTSSRPTGMPARPPSAYLMFLKDAYPKNSNLSALEASKGLAARWKAMSDMEKSRYITQAKSALEEYNLTLARMDPKVLEALRAEHKKTLEDKKVTKAKRSLAKVIRESGRPKQPATGFILFGSKMSQSPDIKFLPDAATKTKRIGEMWRSLSPQDKKNWQDKYKAARKVYEVDIAKWTKDNPEKVKAIEAATAATKPLPVMAPPKKKAVKKVIAKPKVKAKAKA